ncbi:MAG: M23 family metallopeptidase [Actinomycetota bacterium]|nr:M23 family metallopeptidase [Actinomycetota bacterium]
MTRPSEPASLAESFAAHTRLQVGAATLDRMSAPGEARVRRRRRRFRLRQLGAVVAVAAAVAGSVALGASVGERTATRRPPLAAAQGGRLDVSDVGQPRSAGATTTTTSTAFASYADLQLVLPSDQVRLVGFHEAAFADALPLTPAGSLLANDNTTKFRPPPDRDGVGYVVLSSRGRTNPATSAVDVALPPGTPVASLIDGTVTLVEHYQLYGRHPDTRVEIAPAGRLDLRVVLIHLTDVRVRPGQRVQAGRTVVAGAANFFPFRSHVDRYVEGDPGPHVHIEVKRPASGA